MDDQREAMKQSCLEALADLATFIDGELTEDKRQRIESHLDDCPPCVDAHGFERELRVVIAHRCQEQVPEELRQRIALAIAQVDQTDA